VAGHVEVGSGTMTVGGGKAVGSATTVVGGIEAGTSSAPPSDANYAARAIQAGAGIVCTAWRRV
jgi:hypothetical protein